MSLTDKLSNLHTLLRVRSFERWPLNVQFFSDDVFRVWSKLGDSQPSQLRDGIQVAHQSLVVASASAANAASNAPPSAVGIGAVDVTYASWKPHFEKSHSLLSSNAHLACVVCKEALRPAMTLAVVCPHNGCETVAHLSCMSDSFLAQESNAAAIVPTTGKCLGCNQKLNWQDLVKDLSLRLRGQKETEMLMKKQRRRKAKGTADGALGLAQEASATSTQQLMNKVPHLLGVAEDDAMDVDLPGDVRLNSLEVDEDDWISREPDDDEVPPFQDDEWADIDEILEGDNEPVNDEWADIDDILDNDSDPVMR